jgi:glutamyl-tRNA reductase
MQTSHPVLRVIGVSHKTAPVEIREQLAFSSERLASAYESIKGQDAISECVILSTCNRFEVYVLLQEQHNQDHGTLEEALLGWFAEDGARLGDYAYYRFLKQKATPIYGLWMNAFLPFVPCLICR